LRGVVLSALHFLNLAL